MVVVLEGSDDKELKVKEENVTLEKALKSGFLAGKSKEDPEVFKPTGKKEGPLDDLKDLGINKVSLSLCGSCAFILWFPCRSVDADLVANMLSP